MPWIKVGKVSDLPPESVMEVMVDRHPYAICHSGGEIRALDGVCPHVGGPLGEGTVQDGHVVCPFHMWAFDCRTGALDFNPARRLATFDVRIEDGEIHLQVPPGA